jgi:signal transduction histidine kinase
VAIVVVLGLAGGFFVTRRVLKRVDAMTETTRTIMGGDLAGRLPVAGTGDELDRLAENLNVMLERIEALMHGLKGGLRQHRARSQDSADAAAQPLRGSAAAGGRRIAISRRAREHDRGIGCADPHLQRLLMIARAESGQARDDMSEFDAAEIARGVGELYEPLADDKGILLKVEAPTAAPVHGNRELISQALANLVDNAIKYGAPNGARRTGRCRDRRQGGGRGRSDLLSGRRRRPGIPKPTAAAPSSGSCGSSRAARSRARGWAEPRSAVARLHGGELKLEDNHPGLRTVISLRAAGH